ncbi:GNAT family N-acetyltransferase [Halobacteriales archaeon QS_8_69_26]|nr:MAG: GNAT family N-acetyltransferase [Halobacteriales archaeon QS_8_69_26]
MADPEFRRVPPEDRVEFRRFVDYAFSPEAGPREYDGTESVPDRPGDRFGVYEDGDLRSVCARYDFTVNCRGKWVPLAALASGATMPEYRRQSYLGRLLSGCLEKCRGEYPLAALWPFDYGYYERFGWAVGSEITEYTCPPEQLAFGRDAPGTVRRLEPDDWPRLRAVDEVYARNRDLVVRRDEEWWRERIFRTGGGNERYVYGIERDGELRAYVAYTVESDGGDRRIHALYAAAADHEARLGLLGFLSNHDSQVESVTLYRGGETSLLDLVSDPKAVDCEIHPGTMVRVVDVVDALSAVGYPDEVGGTLTMAVEDDTAAWNDGPFELSVSDGRGECRRVEEGDPDVRLDIGTLSQVLVGYHSVPEARRLADLRVDDEAAADRLAAWFPSRPVDPLDDF